MLSTTATMASAVQTWFGGTGNFSDAQNWLPPGLPANINTLIIDAGRAIADDLTITNPLIRLGSPTTTPTLVLRNSTLAASNTISVQATTFDPSQPDVSAMMQVAGTVTEDGSIIVSAHPAMPFEPFPVAHLTINMAKGNTFVMDPGAVWVSQSRSTLTVNAPEHGAQFVNNGDIQASGGTVTINAPVTGQGRFDVSNDMFKILSGTLEFTEDVGAGQTVNFGSGSNLLLKLDEPKEFHASIAGFDQTGPLGSTIELTNTKVTSAEYLNSILTLFDHHQVEAKLNIAGQLTTQDFAIFNRGGDAFINVETPRVQTWFGGTGDFSDPQNWSPFFGSLPATNHVIINAGQAVADDLVITNPTIQLGSPQTASTLVLHDTTLAATTAINVETTTLDPSQLHVEASIKVVGAVTEDGTIDVGTTGTDVNQLFPAHLTVAMAEGSRFTMDPGAIWFSRDGSTLDVNAAEHAAQFVNNGEIEAFGGTVRMDVAVTGQGTFDVVFNNNQIRAGTLEFTENVGAGQTVKLDAGTLKLDEPREFHGSIADFNANSTIELADTKITSADFSNGVLTLFDRHRVEARLDIAGNFTTDQFAISNRNGDAFITFAPPAAASAQNASGTSGSNLDTQAVARAPANHEHTADISAPASTPGYNPNTGSAGGASTASDSSQTASLVLLGQYAAAGFVMAGDAHGGTTSITQLPANEPSGLAHPQI